MKVGDYVRTRWGCIAKFEGINEEFYEFDNIIMDESSAVREELFVDIVEKSSPNIIDLIEVGDILTIRDIFGNLSKVEVDENFKLLSGKIVSIVTKESFERMEYKVNEND